MHAGQRDLDIVIYGATGFVGRLTAEYLAKAGAGIRVALAGRSAERLLAVRQALGAGAENWPLIVADLAQPAALTRDGGSKPGSGKCGRAVQQTWAAGRGGMRHCRNRLRRPNR